MAQGESHHVERAAPAQGVARAAVPVVVDDAPFALDADGGAKRTKAAGLADDSSGSQAGLACAEEDGVAGGGTRDERAVVAAGLDATAEHDL